MREHQLFTKGSGLVADHDLTVTDVDEDHRVAADVAVKDGLGQEVYQLLLHKSLDRAGTVLRLITLCAHVILEILCKLDCDTILGKLYLKVTHLHAENLSDISL